MHGRIDHPFSPTDSAYVSGFAAFDEISMDADELVSADDFMFLFTREFNYP